MATIDIGAVTLGIESFGVEDAPALLLIGAPTMLSWPDAMCGRIAAGGCRVVRYDLRDSGESSTADPCAPGYTLRDLAADAAALVPHLGDGPAHIAGIGVGGMVAQVAVLDHPDEFRAMTLVGTRPVAPGRPDADLPDHDPVVLRRLRDLPVPRWTDRRAVEDFAVARAEALGDDPESARVLAGRVWDRTPRGATAAAHTSNQSESVFARLDCRPRWRERLPGITVPTLVVHGRSDPFFPLGNGAALGDEITGARLLVLAATGSGLPAAATDEVADAMIALDGRTRTGARRPRVDR